MRKIIELIKKLFLKVNYIFYVGSSDILPEPLSKEEEVKYVELSLNGDEFARNKLIEHNLRLVVFLAKKYENTNIDLEDLVSIGTIGLIKGVNTYKLDKNMLDIAFMNCKSSYRDFQFIKINDIEIDKDKDGEPIIALVADKEYNYEVIPGKVHKIKSIYLD